MNRQFFNVNTGNIISHFDAQVEDDAGGAREKINLIFLVSRYIWKNLNITCESSGWDNPGSPGWLMLNG